MISFPNAKINIGLNIVNRRDDGYHDIETIFYPVKLRDAVEVVESDVTTLTTSGIQIPGDPNTNLLLKAYQLIRARQPLPSVHIHLHKNIPIGAGLGGGSADAAFFIALLNDKFRIGLSIEEMEAYARQLGADCAFFLHNKPMYGFGKGDEFEAADLDLSPYHIALVVPPVHVSTAQAYSGVKATPSLTSLQESVKLPISKWRSLVKNDFEESVFNLYPQIQELKTSLYAAGALYASMSGSGSSVYAIFGEKPDLTSIAGANLVSYDV